MTRQRLKWDVPKAPPPEHPYRDTLLVYGGLAVVVILIALLTGGSFTRAVVYAALFFVVASAYTLYRLRARAAEARRDAARLGDGP